MSAVAHSVYGSPRPQASARPGLRAVARPRPRVNVKFGIAVVSAMVLLVVARVFVQVAVESSAYEIASLNAQNVSLARDASFLTEQLNVLDSPQNVAAMAASLGMVSNSSPTYLRLSDGNVWGSGAPARAGSVAVAPIANELITQYGGAPDVAGVASTTVSASASQSVSTTPAVAPQSGIPAPATH